MSVQVYLSICGVVIGMISIVSAFVTHRVAKNNLSEKIKLDVTTEQMLILEEKIRKFYKKHDIQNNFSISKIAEILNVEQGGVEEGLTDQGCLKEIKNSEKKIVVFKEGLSETEKRFVFAHEIAHLLNGDRIPVARPNGRNKAQIEQLADYTAAALLMPFDLIEKYLVENNYEESSAKKRTIFVRELCKEYDVTEVIALRRVKEVYALKQLNA